MPAPSSRGVSGVVREQVDHLLSRVAFQVFVCLNIRRLVRRLELTRHGLWIVMLHAAAAQQCDQGRPTLVLDAALILDPGANLEDRPRQCLAYPSFQLLLLLLFA